MPASNCPATPNEGITNGRIAYLAFLAAAIAFVIIFFGGIAAIGYADLKGKEWSAGQVASLFAVSFGSAIVVGALLAAWRLINRRTPQWGVAAVVIAVLLFAFLVWPTPWTYVEHGCVVHRVNRLFGTYDNKTQLPSCEPKPAGDETKG
jgi:hypothetical protein